MFALLSFLLIAGSFRLQDVSAQTVGSNTTVAVTTVAVTTVAMTTGPDRQGGGGQVEGTVSTEVPGCTPTPRDVQGPYYLPGVKHQHVVCRGGPYLLVTGTVRDTRCSPVAKATLEVWQADPTGCYKINPQRPNFCRGKVRTDARGRYSFLTVMPGQYGSGWWHARPVHVHFRVSARRRRPLVTQLYFSGNASLGERDPCKFCGSDNPSQLTTPRPPSGEEENYTVGGTRYRVREVAEWDIVLN
ncbi:chlorocatechol 1,2-dioxygenase-like isoform X1 [Branchiostoma floridae x Branchiostoma belcheri]